MFQIILYIFLAYILYRLVFGFILPVYRTTRRFKKQFNEMRNRMEGQENTQSPRQEPSPKPVGDYIDFEEVK